MTNCERAAKWNKEHHERRMTIMRKYRKNHIDQLRNAEYKRYYGITVDDYNRMYAEQDGQCKICSRPQFEMKQALSVDHDHVTRKIRGLLCIRCNNRLATLEDKEFCAKASLYLAEGI